MLVGSVLNGSDRTVSFVQTVNAPYHVSITILVLELIVSSVRVFHLILVLVLRICLQ